MENNQDSNPETQDTQTDFELCTEYKFIHERHQVSCKLGLWSVESKDKEVVMREAMHYFTQYRDDGEYSSVIDSLNTLDSLRGLVSEVKADRAEIVNTTNIIVQTLTECIDELENLSGMTLETSDNKTLKELASKLGKVLPMIKTPKAGKVCDL